MTRHRRRRGPSVAALAAGAGCCLVALTACTTGTPTPGPSTTDQSSTGSGTAGGSSASAVATGTASSLPVPPTLAPGVSVIGGCVSVLAADDSRAAVRLSVPAGFAVSSPRAGDTAHDVRLQRGHNYADGSDASFAIVEVAEHSGEQQPAEAARSSLGLLVTGAGVTTPYPPLPGASVTTWDPVAPGAQPPVDAALTVWTVPTGHSTFTVALYAPRTPAAALVPRIGGSIALGSC